MMLNHGGLCLTTSLRIRQMIPTFVSHIARVLYSEVKLDRSKNINLENFTRLLNKPPSHKVLMNG